MLHLMSRYPDVVWLLVGGEGKLPDALQSSPPGRVRALATRDDLPGILRCADIYVNPPRMGGGFSVAEAMAEGLPVTSLSGSDGGDKVGELALPDIDATWSGWRRSAEILSCAGKPGNCCGSDSPNASTSTHRARRCWRPSARP
jgi:hypothetical protein